MEHGCMMPDPLGNLHYGFTLLISFIANMPEACLIACVWGKTSPITTASYKNIGDPFWHLPHTTILTKCQLKTIKHLTLNIKEFFAACTDFCLSGVSLPFWWNWQFASPSHFFTPEALHYWHCECWNHNVQWCKVELGNAEIDFCFSVLPKITGLHHFKNEITNLKQVCGRTQRYMQQYLVVIIAGSAPLMWSLQSKHSWTSGIFLKLQLLPHGHKIGCRPHCMSFTITNRQSLMSVFIVTNRS